MNKTYKNILIIFLFGYNSVIFAQSNPGVICEDKIIAGQVVKRCYYGTKPGYTHPSPPDINIPNQTINVNPPKPNGDQPFNYPRGGTPIEGRITQRETFNDNYHTRKEIALKGTEVAVVSFNPLNRGATSGHFGISPTTSYTTPHKTMISVSKEPGDFSKLDGTCGGISRNHYMNINFNTNPSAPGKYCLLEPGVNYYINIKFVDLTGLTTCTDPLIKKDCGVYLDINFSK